MLNTEYAKITLILIEIACAKGIKNVINVTDDKMNAGIPMFVMMNIGFRFIII